VANEYRDQINIEKVGKDEEKLKKKKKRISKKTKQG